MRKKLEKDAKEAPIIRQTKVVPEEAKVTNCKKVHLKGNSKEILIENQSFLPIANLCTQTPKPVDLQVSPMLRNPFPILPKVPLRSKVILSVRQDWPDQRVMQRQCRRQDGQVSGRQEDQVFVQQDQKGMPIREVQVRGQTMMMKTTMKMMRIKHAVQAIDLIILVVRVKGLTILAVQAKDPIILVAQVIDLTIPEVQAKGLTIREVRVHVPMKVLEAQVLDPTIRQAA